MSQPAHPIRARSRSSLRFLLALPLACAPLFLGLAMSNRVSPKTLEDGWIDHPESEFPIKDGDWAGWGENHVYIASVSGRWGGYYPEPGPKEVEDLRQALFPPEEPTEKSM